MSKRIYIDEGESIIDLNDVDSDISSKELMDILNSRLEEKREQNLFGDLTGEGEEVGDDDISWFKEEIKSMSVSEYMDNVREWVKEELDEGYIDGNIYG